MTSGSAGRRRRAPPRPRSSPPTSSAFGITTCTSIVSPSVTGFHFGFCGRSRTRIDWCSISSRDVDVDVLGNVGRQALHLDLAGHEVEHAALQLDALRLALARQSARSRVIALSIASW